MSDILKQITIPTPCHADWASMTGDDRTRYCQECGKSVVNLSALTEEEATSVVEEQGDSLCAQVTRRKDGSVVTAKPHARFGIRSLMIVIAWIAGALGFFKFMANDSVVLGRMSLAPGSTSAPACDANGNPIDDPDCDLEEEM
jgi:hypothetical protein